MEPAAIILALAIGGGMGGWVGYTIGRQRGYQAGADEVRSKGRKGLWRGR